MCACHTPDDEMPSKEITGSHERNPPFYFQQKQGECEEERAASAHIWQAPGCFCTLSCIAAVFWKVASRAACFSSEGKRGVGRRGHAQRSKRPAVPNRARLDWF